MRGLAGILRGAQGPWPLGVFPSAVFLGAALVSTIPGCGSISPGAVLPGAASPSARTARAAGADATRVLLITGNKHFEREPFLDVFRADPTLQITHLEHSGESADAWLRADVERADAVVLYDMPEDIDSAQRARFLSIFESGAGLLVLHHALVSFQSWPDYERIIGGRYVDPGKGGDASARPSGYQHDVFIPVQRMTAHPVSAGVEDFTIHDEIYWDYRVGADVVPLLRTTHPNSGNPIAWARSERNSRVIYLQLGHGPSAYEHPSYRRLVSNAIHHVARR